MNPLKVDRILGFALNLVCRFFGSISSLTMIMDEFQEFYQIKMAANKMAENLIILKFHRTWAILALDDRV